MAKALQGILGPVSGKVGGVVAASWKNINYVRGYAKPAYTRTEGQAAQRNKFAACVNFAKLLIGQVFNVYTDRFLKDKSGFNYFISRNIAHFGDPVEWNKIKVTEGKLFMGQISDVSGSADDDLVNVSFSSATGNNGSDTDKIYGLVYNERSGIVTFLDEEENRSYGQVTFETSLQSGDVVHVWLWASKYQEGNIVLISDSVYYSYTVS